MITQEEMDRREATRARVRERKRAKYDSGKRRAKYDSSKRTETHKKTYDIVRRREAYKNERAKYDSGKRRAKYDSSKRTETHKETYDSVRRREAYKNECDSGKERKEDLLAWMRYTRANDTNNTSTYRDLILSKVPPMPPEWNQSSYRYEQDTEDGTGGFNLKVVCNSPESESKKQPSMPLLRLLLINRILVRIRTSVASLGKCTGVQRSHQDKKPPEESRPTVAV